MLYSSVKAACVIFSFKKNIEIVGIKHFSNYKTTISYTLLIEKKLKKTVVNQARTSLTGGLLEIATKFHLI